ncbi:metal-dependent hydrolase [Paenibacillus agilis]|uniref:Metal-dependent hydrolase n=1 Tax=Paenibacillus agilis TaxID=3020863 RepID=A0A559IHH5_9BACL|nr:metal-dependent hydrolase [Paenibacillus agilis]TVX87094.1 metal-dependent hydrolase [Paenibacillus agilis]
MDSISHLAIGLGLAGLSQIDPIVAADTTTATAVLAGTIIGSQAPDFDTIFKFKGNEIYVRNHRGFSHSLPMLVVWSLLITGGLHLLIPTNHWPHVLLWTAIAVVLHVFTDLFNTYGTQAIRPFSERWISWNIIPIFDPFIFTSHLIAVAIWMFGWIQPTVLFPVLYIILAVYYVWRTLTHRLLIRRLPKLDNEHKLGERYTLIPTVVWSQWNLVKKCKNGVFRVGQLHKNRVVSWTETAKCDEHPAVEASKSETVVKTFQYFTRYGCATVQPTGYGFVVRWVDVRYRHRKQYPFVAVVMMNAQYETLDTYIGWLSEEKLYKRCGLEPV